MSIHSIYDVSIVIPTIAGREDLLYRLLGSLPKEAEIIIMDIETMPLAEKRNKGAERATGKCLLFVDDDNYLAPGSIESAFFLLSHKNIGVAGFMACYDHNPEYIADGGSLRNVMLGFTKGLNTNERYADIKKTWYPVDEVANCFMIRKELFDDLGGFDTRRFPIDLDEADLCKRVRDRGLIVAMCPEARCYHKSITYSRIPDFRRPKNAYYMARNRILYNRKHQDELQYPVYLYIFMPIFVLSYVACLLLRGRLKMIKPFMEGVIDGCTNRTENKY